MRKLYIYEHNGSLGITGDKTAEIGGLIIHEFEDNDQGVIDFFKGIKINEDISILLNKQILEVIFWNFFKYIVLKNKTIELSLKYEFFKDIAEYNRTTGGKMSEIIDGILKNLKVR